MCACRVEAQQREAPAEDLVEGERVEELEAPDLKDHEKLDADPAQEVGGHSGHWGAARRVQRPCGVGRVLCVC
jgi:hypothetical protein